MIEDIAVAPTAPAVGVPEGAVVLSRDEGRRIPTTIRVEGEVAPDALLDHLDASFEAADWARTGRHVDGRLGVASWTWTQHGAHGVATAVVRPDAGGDTRLVVTVLD